LLAGFLVLTALTQGAPVAVVPPPPTASAQVSPFRSGQSL